MTPWTPTERGQISKIDKILGIYSSALSRKTGKKSRYFSCWAGGRNKGFQSKYLPFNHTQISLAFWYISCNHAQNVVSHNRAPFYSISCITRVSSTITEYCWWWRMFVHDKRDTVHCAIIAVMQPLDVTRSTSLHLLGFFDNGVASMDTAERENL